jgi:hypothetical protein
MSDIISDPRQTNIEEAIASRQFPVDMIAKCDHMKGMDEANRQIDVGRVLFMKSTGKPAHHFDALSPSERRPYIDQACLPAHRNRNNAL